MANIREKILMLLERPGMTRKVLSIALNVTESHLSRILNGQRETSRKFDKAIDDLLEGKGRQPHPNPTIEAVIQMMESMDEETQKDVQVGVQKEKLLRELMKEKQEKEAA